jgi:hypothetical protein
MSRLVLGVSRSDVAENREQGEFKRGRRGYDDEGEGEGEEEPIWGFMGFAGCPNVEAMDGS